MICPCGVDHPFESPNTMVLAKLIELKGEVIVVHTPDGSWEVPRLYIGFHGLRADDVPALAAKYGWARAER